MSSLVSENTRRGDGPPSADAEKPFDSSARADVILRSSDSVDFFVLKLILSIASPIFDDMFSLDRGDAKEKNLSETKRELPIVPLTEDSETLYNLLQLVYPYDGEPSDLDICVKVAPAAQKYAMDMATRKLRKIILACEAMEQEPLKVLTVGVHFVWVEVIKEASLRTLSIPVRNLLCAQCKESQGTTAPDLSDLFSWRYACQDALRKLFTSYPWSRKGPLWTTMSGYLKERLEETGCPHSAVLMGQDDSVVVKAIQKVPGNSISAYSDIMSTRRAMMKEIEEEILKVPFRVRDIWIIPPQSK